MPVPRDTTMKIPLVFRYRFILGHGEERDFIVTINRETLDLIQPEKKEYPDWTALDHHQCPNCPLHVEKHPRCPAAVSLIDVVEFFKKSISYEEADVIIETEEREYRRHATLQQAVSSLMGIYMPTSGCPVMAKLKPLVRFHLPFASVEETEYRGIGMYLMAQYFLAKRGKRPEWDLNGLEAMYDEIRTVNKGFWKRLSTLRMQDANVNALVILDNFAQAVKMSINKHVLHRIEHLFQAFLT